MRAALAARGDPSLVIAGRTPALKIEGLDSAVARAKAYATAGVDAIFLVGGLAKPGHIEDIRTIHAAAKLPLILGSSMGLLDRREEAAACGARLMVQGHQPIAAAVKALRETYTHLFNGGAPADLKSKIAPAQEMEQLVNGENYKLWLREYMR